MFVTCVVIQNEVRVLDSMGFFLKAGMQRRLVSKKKLEGWDY